MSLPATFQASELCDPAAGGWERSHVDVTGRLLMDTNVDAISYFWDAYEAPAELLPFVAFNMSVNLYEDYWNDDTKRAWIDGNWNFLSLRGTIKAMRMALAASGYHLIEAVAPPQGTFASPDMTDAERAKWLALMPEIRITFARRRGTDNGQAFADQVFADDGFSGVDDGAALFGRYGVLRRNGEDIPLVNLTVTKSIEDHRQTDFETMAIPGLSTLGLFEGDSYSGDDRFVDAEEEPAQIVNFRSDTLGQREVYSIGTDTLSIDLKPIDIRPEINSDVGDAGLDVFASDGFSDDAFVYPDEAAYMLAESLRLLDPKVQTFSTAGFSFADVDRVGIDRNTIELLVDLGLTERNFSAIAEESFASDAYAMPEDTSHIDRAIRAIEAARGITQRTLVSFQDKRPLAVRDPVDESTLAGAWVQNSL